MTTRREKEIEKEAKTPDAFLTTSDHLLKWAEKHGRLIGSLAALLFFGGLIWTGVGQVRNYKEKTATREIYIAEQLLIKKQEEVAKKEAKVREDFAKAQEGKKQKDKAALPAIPPVDFSANYEAAARAIELAVDAHRDTEAAAAAALRLSSLYRDFKKVQEAEGILARIKLSESNFLYPLIEMQKATLAMEAGDYNRAQTGFEQLSRNKAAEFLQAEALLKQGLCLEKLEQKDRAKEIYNRLSTEFPESQASRTAKGYLRLLDLQSSAKGNG